MKMNIPSNNLLADGTVFLFAHKEFSARFKHKCNPYYRRLFYQII